MITHSAERFVRIAAAFDSAWRAASAEGCEALYGFAGATARVRIVGHSLARQVHPAIAHLRVDDARSTPTLTIDLWDETVSGVRGLGGSDRHADGRSWRMGDGVFAASPDGRLVSQQLRSSVVWFDRLTQHIAGWYADAADVSLHQRGKPLQMMLALWASDRGLQAVHAALVARHGAGALIPGSSGSGKSTAALSCVHAGYTYFGDDWIGIGAAADGTVRGHGLYNSTFLEPHHARHFPHLHPHLIAPRDASEIKSLLLLTEVVPAQLGSAATIRALALPRIIDGAASRMRPAAKRDALLVLIPSSIFEMHPRSGPAGVDRLARLVEQVPAYWLEIGRDLNEIPRCVDEILAAAGGTANAG